MFIQTNRKPALRCTAIVNLIYYLYSQKNTPYKKYTSGKSKGRQFLSERK